MTIPEAIAIARTHHQAGRLPEAEKLYREILVQNPNEPQALYLLGLLAHQSGNFPAAVELMTLAIQQSPGVSLYRGQLGLALSRLSRLDEAISTYRQAVLLQPDFAQAHNNLGNALVQKGLLDQALVHLKAAAKLLPDSAEVFTSLGIVHYEMHQFDEAIAAHRKAIALRPEYTEAHNNLGNSLNAAGKTDEAIAALKKAVELSPGYAEAHNNLGNVLRDAGEIPAALAGYERAVKFSPFDGFHSNLIYCMHYHPDYNTLAICAELAKWNRLHAVPLANRIQPHRRDRSPQRRLRVGYVSPDFRRHVVGWNLLPLLSHHDRRNFEIFCYSSVVQPDEMTEKLKEHADVWRNLTGIGNEPAAKIIREDKIDILVDLSLHSAQNRLALFAEKPAPVQVTYLGYCGSTGVQTIDYRFSDPHIDPPDMVQPYAERTICLPKTYWCYQPGGPTPPPGPLPAESSGHITFGCLNNFAKVSDAALQLWSTILDAVPGSKLLLHAPEGIGRNRVLKFIPPDRVEFVAKLAFEEYVALYQKIDIALDPFPYGGGITTCDALWMGVPVVTLEGQTAVGRGGKSILYNLELKELAARTAVKYETIAIELAGDRNRLTKLRTELRENMKRSPLMNSARFARDVEAIYRDIWKQWIAKARP